MTGGRSGEVREWQPPDIAWSEIGGGILFGIIVVATAALLRWLVLAWLAYEPHCVYRIPLTDGRVYWGHAKDPNKRGAWHRTAQRRMADGNPRKWWPLVPLPYRDAVPFVMPDEWVHSWYRSKAVAEQFEQKFIREDEARGQVTANRIKYKGAVTDEAE